VDVDGEGSWSVRTLNVAKGKGATETIIHFQNEVRHEWAHNFQLQCIKEIAVPLIAMSPDIKVRQLF
jgi:hypothetical protein